MRLNLGKRQNRARAVLVAHAEYRFARMTERAVANVVQHQRGAQQAPLVSDVLFIIKELPPVAEQLVERARSDRERAQRVAKTRMFGGWEREVRQTKLAQAPQALQRRRVQQARLGGLQLDEVMDGIVDPLHNDRFCGFCGSGGDSGAPAKMR